MNIVLPVSAAFGAVPGRLIELFSLLPLAPRFLNGFPPVLEVYVPGNGIFRFFRDFFEKFMSRMFPFFLRRSMYLARRFSDFLRKKIGDSLGLIKEVIRHAEKFCKTAADLPEKGADGYIDLWKGWGRPCCFWERGGLMGDLI